MRYLLIAFSCSVLPLYLMGQERAFIFSVQKELLNPIDNGFYGAHMTYAVPWKNNVYYLFRSGFRSREFIDHSSLETTQERNHIVLDPELEFVLWDYVSVDPSITRTGMRQSKTKRVVNQTIPIGIGIGKTWLNDSDKFRLYTDLGGGVTYIHTVLYGWGDLINIEGIEPPGELPYFTMMGKAISRELRPLVDIKAEFSYFLFENLGIGINLYISGVMDFETYTQLGVHLRYQY
ncbi:MAG: hypothetical protein EA411_13215 [Saprospirales bacterium]|nr:MAG: hypothetical protein EA411_13215 [Saprospirales bacterium]